MVYKDQFCIKEYVQGKYVLKFDLAVAVLYALKHNPQVIFQFSYQDWSPTVSPRGMA